jgi:hypothetical protein
MLGRPGRGKSYNRPRYMAHSSGTVDRLRRAWNTGRFRLVGSFSRFSVGIMACSLPHCAIAPTQFVFHGFPLR